MKPEDIVKKIKFVAVLFIILIIGIFLPTNKIEAATEKYSETINGISWTVSIDGNGYVYIEPSDKRFGISELWEFDRDYNTKWNN